MCYLPSIIIVIIESRAENRAFDTLASFVFQVFPLSYVAALYYSNIVLQHIYVTLEGRKTMRRIYLFVILRLLPLSYLPVGLPQLLK